MGQLLTLYGFGHFVVTVVIANKEEDAAAQFLSG
jgi:hypothetical protein